MVPIITREGIEALKGNACDGCHESNARLRNPPAQRSSRRRVSDFIAREIVGHESAAVSQQYSHLSTEHKRNAMRNLPDVTE
jgi:hypothetical protein